MLGIVCVDQLQGARHTHISHKDRIEKGKFVRRANRRLLVKCCYDNKMVKVPFNLIIFCNQCMFTSFQLMCMFFIDIINIQNVNLSMKTRKKQFFGNKTLCSTSVRCELKNLFFCTKFATFLHFLAPKWLKLTILTSI